MQTFSLKLASWPDIQTAAGTVRHQVFVVEQGVPPELELDEHDATAVHIVALDAAGSAIGTGRLLPDGHIGRVSVLPRWRGKGVGWALMQALLNEASRLGYPRVELSAQCTAQAFYEAMGFQVVGTPYLEAGLLHIAMQRPLSAA